MERALLQKTGVTFTYAGDTPEIFCTYPSIRLDYKSLPISTSCSSAGVLSMEPSLVNHVLGIQSGGCGAPRAGEHTFLSHVEVMIERRRWSRLIAP